MVAMAGFQIKKKFFKISISTLTCDVKSREKGTILLQKLNLFLLLGHHFLARGIECWQCILFNGVCNRLAPVDKSFIDERVKWDLPDLDNILHNVNDGLVYDILCVNTITLRMMRQRSRHL